MYCTVLYCTVLYCTVLYCTVLYCTVYCTELCTVGQQGHGDNKHAQEDRAGRGGGGEQGLAPPPGQDSHAGHSVTIRQGDIHYWVQKGGHIFIILHFLIQDHGYFFFLLLLFFSEDDKRDSL